MSLQSTELVSLFRRELELCQVKPGQTVAVLSEAERQTEYANAFMMAARELDAHVFNLTLLPGKGAGVLGFSGAAALAGNQPAIEALKSADLVVDLMFLLFSKEQLEIQKAGARILLCVEPPEVLARLFPTADLRERAEAAERRLANGHELRFTNQAGTNVTYQLGKFPAMCEYGYTDTPGRWDHWPSGFAFTGAGETEVNGRVVMDRGDIVYPFASYLRDPIDFTIRDGRIVDIKGGLDAELLRDYMASYRDPQAYGISHIGWGLNERANWTCHAQGVGGIGMEGRAFYGNVLFSTGPNTELGGTNNTACHLDLPMRNCTLYLDDELIVKEGAIMPEDMRVPGR